MTTNAKRSHGAQPDESSKTPKILTAVRQHNAIDKNGRALEGERKLFVPGMEDELEETLTDDELNILESGGFVQGLGVNLPTERSIRKDPTVRANAEDESTNVSGNPTRQMRATPEQLAEDAEGATERKAKRKARRGKAKKD